MWAIKKGRARPSCCQTQSPLKRGIGTLHQLAYLFGICPFVRLSVCPSVCVRFALVGHLSSWNRLSTFLSSSSLVGSRSVRPSVRPRSGPRIKENKPKCRRPWCLMMPALHNTERAGAQTTTTTTTTETRREEMWWVRPTEPPLPSSFSKSLLRFFLNLVFVFFFFLLLRYTFKTQVLLFFYLVSCCPLFTVADYCQFHVERYFYFISDQLKLVLLCCCSLFLCDSTFGVWKGSPKILNVSNHN